jgi:WD40 repeat protein
MLPCKHGSRVTTATPSSQCAALSSSPLRAVLHGHHGAVNSAIFSPSGNVVLTGGDDGTVLVGSGDRTADGRAKHRSSGALPKLF